MELLGKIKKKRWRGRRIRNWALYQMIEENRGIERLCLDLLLLIPPDPGPQKEIEKSVEGCLKEISDAIQTYPERFTPGIYRLPRSVWLPSERAHWGWAWSIGNGAIAITISWLEQAPQSRRLGIDILY